MGNSPFLPNFNAPAYPMGPSLAIAPSNLAMNVVAPSPPSLVALIALVNKTAAAVDALREVLDDVLPGVAKRFGGAFAAMRAMAGLADALDETFKYRIVEGRPSAPELGQKAATLKAKTHALMDAATRKTGQNFDPRKTIKALDDAVRERSAALLPLVRDPANVAVVKAYANDTSIPVAARFQELAYFAMIQKFALEYLARTERADEVDRIAEEVLQQNDAAQSVPAVTIKESKTLWDAFVASATTATGLVGNLPAPDSLSMVLVKLFAARRLPGVAVNQAKATRLERELFTMIVEKLGLTAAQKQDLQGRMADLKAAQREVIKKAQEEAETAQRLPGHEARIGRKTRQRVAAEEECALKAERAAEFYKDTYGENEALFKMLQRTPFLDSFVTVLTLVQLCAALKELTDPDVSKLQAGADVAATGLLSLGAVVATVAKHIPALNVGVVKVNLAWLGKLASFLGDVAPAFTGAMAIISGSVQLIEGVQEGNIEKEVVGGLTMLFGALITYGALAASAAATGIGVGIGVLLAGYVAVTWLAEAMKSEADKVFESMVDSLESKVVYANKTALQHLGLESQLEDVKEAMKGWSFFGLAPNPNGAPTRATLIERMSALGFGEEVAKKLVESLEDEKWRMHPRPMPMAPF